MNLIVSHVIAITFLLSFYLLIIFFIFLFTSPLIIKLLIKLNNKKPFCSILVGRIKFWEHFILLHLFMNTFLILFMMYYLQSGAGIKYFGKAKKRDFENSLKNKHCIGILLAGHGDKNFWKDSKN